jgi:hypothetical protein
MLLLWLRVEAHGGVVSLVTRSSLRDVVLRDVVIVAVRTFVSSLIGGSAIILILILR